MLKDCKKCETACYNFAIKTKEGEEVTMVNICYKATGQISSKGIKMVRPFVHDPKKMAEYFTRTFCKDCSNACINLTISNKHSRLQQCQYFLLIHTLRNVSDKEELVNFINQGEDNDRE